MSEREPPGPAPPDTAITAGLPSVSVGRILLQSGPRLVRDSVGPIGAFYLVYRISGGQLLPGVLAGAGLAIAFYAYETWRGRSGVLARLALAFVLLQAAVGFLTRSPSLYFAQPVILDVLLGGVFIGSAAMKRPIIGATAKDAFPFPTQVAESQTFQRIYGRLSLLWGAYFLVRSVIRLAAVLTRKVDTMVVVNTVTDVPFVIALIALSTWYGVNGFRRSAEWGPLIRMVDAGIAADIDSAATIRSDPGV